MSRRVLQTRGIAVHGDRRGRVRPRHGRVRPQLPRAPGPRAPAARRTSTAERSWTCGPASRTGGPGGPFEHDTATVIFSCTKGVMAVCAYLLVQEGRLDLDAPIAHYWPEFAQAGKERITVREAMAHRAGLAYLDTDLTLDDVVAWDPVIHAIEAQRPHHAPDGRSRLPRVDHRLAARRGIRRITGLAPGTNFRRRAGRPAGPGHVDRDAGPRRGARSPGWSRRSPTTTRSSPRGSRGSGTTRTSCAPCRWARRSRSRPTTAR